jgi:RNA polymerase sigma factor (sigma-70 family)
MSHADRLALFSQHQYLPAFFWRKMHGHLPGAAVMGFDEFTQTASLALWEACLNYDPSRGCKPMTYLYRYVWGTMMTACKQHATGGVITVKSGSRIPADQPGTRRTIPLSILLAAREGEHGCKDGDLRELAAPEPRESDVDEERVAAALTALHPRVREILHCRFWLHLSLQATGDRLGISKERVRQLETRGLARVRRYFNGGVQADKLDWRTCQQCGEGFFPKRSAQVFCKTRCQRRAAMARRVSCRKCGRRVTCKQIAGGKCDRCRPLAYAALAVAERA